jgi:hypothetical protein
MAFPGGEKTNSTAIKNGDYKAVYFVLRFLPWTWTDKDSEVNLIFLDLSALDLFTL